MRTADIVREYVDDTELFLLRGGNTDPRVAAVRAALDSLVAERDAANASVKSSGEFWLERVKAAEADAEVRKRLYEASIKDRARLRDALTAYVEDDCRELADGEGLTTEEARLTYSPRYRWGRAALGEDA